MSGHERTSPAENDGSRAAEPLPGAESKSADAPARSPRPPRGPRVRYLLLALAAAVLFFWAGHVLGDWVAAPLARGEDASASSEHAGEHGEGELSFYTCGMHPWVILPGPGDCPICHMRLTPLDPAKFSGEITIDPVVTQNIGVRVAPVVTGPLTRTIRTVGKVVYDETAVRDINIRVDGWIQKLYVDYEGARVERGQPLFDVFSRELYSAQEEYLLTYNSRGGREVEFLPRVGADLERNLRSARRRLELFGITPPQIQALEEQGSVSETMTITSPYEGFVTDKHAFEGMQVTPGMLTYRIADLSTVWVFVTMYEYQLPYLELGQTMVMTLPYIPGQRFEGTVTHIYPWLEERTREVRVRLEVPNPGLLLKPGMFANVELAGTLADDRTLAPREAVLDTGERQVAFVSLGAGRFEPREVRMGVQAEDGMVEILSGLQPGEMVVTSGQFLLDSESKIREALGKMIRGDLASEQERAVAVVGASELDSLPEAAAAELSGLLDASFAIGERLARDELEGTEDEARRIAAAVDRLLAVPIPGHEHFWHEHDEVATVRGEALALAAARDLEEGRLRFGDLNVALATLLRATGIPPSYGREVRELHCPMYREGQGGSTWLQPAGDVRNPYFGPVMLECFDSEHSLPVTGAQATSAAGAPALLEGTSDPTVEARTDPAAAPILTAYLAASATLARDATDGLEPLLATLGEEAAGLAGDAEPEVREAAARLAAAAAAARRAEGIDAVREQFKSLSRAVLDLLVYVRSDEPAAPALFEAYCPMARASWVQASEPIVNPYYGSSMLDCGRIEREIGTPGEAGPR